MELRTTDPSRTPKDDAPLPSWIIQLVASTTALTGLTYCLHRWLGVLDHLAETYVKLRESGLLNVITW